jgi:hypothetical protein
MSLKLHEFVFTYLVCVLEMAAALNPHALQTAQSMRHPEVQLRKARKSQLQRHYPTVVSFFVIK